MSRSGDWDPFAAHRPPPPEPPAETKTAAPQRRNYDAGAREPAPIRVSFSDVIRAERDWQRGRERDYSLLDPSLAPNISNH
jgi:hypothetical protein